jgi:hypothetical protein
MYYCCVPGPCVYLWHQGSVETYQTALCTNGTKISYFESHLAEIMWRQWTKGNILVYKNIVYNIGSYEQMQQDFRRYQLRAVLHYEVPRGNHQERHLSQTKEHNHAPFSLSHLHIVSFFLFFKFVMFLFSYTYTCCLLYSDIITADDTTGLLFMDRGWETITLF